MTLTSLNKPLFLFFVFLIIYRKISFYSLRKAFTPYIPYITHPYAPIHISLLYFNKYLFTYFPSLVYRIYKPYNNITIPFLPLSLQPYFTYYPYPKIFRITRLFGIPFILSISSIMYIDAPLFVLVYISLYIYLYLNSYLE